MDKATKSEARQTVYCVLCVGPEEVVHIFSTKENAHRWAEADDRDHVLYDYTMDAPELMEQRSS